MKYYGIFYKDKDGYWIRYSDGKAEFIFRDINAAESCALEISDKLYAELNPVKKINWLGKPNSKNKILKDHERELYKLIINSITIREVKIYDY